MKRRLKLIKHILAIALTMFCLKMYGQTKTITGTITDVDGIPLSGATVLIKGTTVGAQSDFDGNFSISAKTGDVLVFSYIGFSSQEITLTNQTKLDVTLEEDASQLDEVVLIGYGSQSKETLATSVGTLDKATLESIPYSNATQSLQGAVSGVRVATTDGRPGSASSISIRGGETPMFVVDGVIRNDIDDLNPQDIKSMNILRDGASTAIYGLKAGDGVVIIETNDGRGRKPSITYNHSTAFSRAPREYDMASVEDFIKFKRLAIAAAGELEPAQLNRLTQAQSFGTGNTPLDDNNPYNISYYDPSNPLHVDLITNEGWKKFVDPVDTVINGGSQNIREIMYKGTDWQDIQHRTAITQSHNLSFTGSGEKFNYDLSLGFLDNEGISVFTGYKRYTGKLSAGMQVRDNLRVSGVINYSLSSIDPIITSSAFERTVGLAPTVKRYRSDGTEATGFNTGDGANPYYLYPKNKFDFRTSKFNGRVQFDWEIIEGLTFKPAFSYFNEQVIENRFRGAVRNTNGSINSSRPVSSNNGNEFIYQLDTQLNYKKSFGGHNVNADLGYIYYDEEDWYVRAAGSGGATDAVITVNGAAEINDGAVTSFWDRERLTGSFARVGYDFNQKYLFGASMRRDVSSKISKENKVGYFPGVSAGWNLHKENFFESVMPSLVNQFKISASYGETGRANNVGTFEIQGLYNVSSTYDGQTAGINTSLANPTLKWETSATSNLAIETRLFNNRVSLLFETFKRELSDKIFNLPLPTNTGFSGIRQNIGSEENKGVEFTVDAAIIDKRDLKWTLNTSLSTIETTITKLPDNGLERNRIGGIEVYDAATGGTKWVEGLQEGQRPGDVYVYKVLGVYATQAEANAGPENQRLGSKGVGPNLAGDFIIKDLDGNGVINTLDREYIGNKFPNVFGGLSSTLSYKGVSLYVRTDYTLGHTVNDQSFIRFHMNSSFGYNVPQRLVTDSWLPNRTDAKYARYFEADFVYQNNYWKDEDGERRNSIFWEKGDYLNIREVTLAYNMPSDAPFLKELGISRLRLYATGNNLGYITNATGLALEVGGDQRYDYQLPSSYILGINISF